MSTLLLPAKQVITKKHQDYMTYLHHQCVVAATVNITR